MVDEIGGLEKAIEVAKQLANLPADKDVRRVVFPAPKSFLQEYLGSSDEDSSETKAQKAMAAALPENVRRAFRYAELFDRMGRGEAMTMMPFELEIK